MEPRSSSNPCGDVDTVAPLAPFRLRAYGACPSTLRAPSPLRRGRESNCFRFPRLSQGSNHLRCSFPCVAGDKTAGVPF